MDKGILLSMKGITKKFPGVVALDNVDLLVSRGEIHALMGENGAGKSTMIKILTGLYARDAGQIIFDGEEINPRNSLDAQNRGIRTIYQELNLIPYLSIAENIFLGNEPRKNGLIDWNRMYHDAADFLKSQMDLKLDVRRPIVECSTAETQMTALARALSGKAKLVIMDEATSSLETTEVEQLFKIIRKLKEKNISVIFITHKLDEIYRICDKLTILKDGQKVGEGTIKDTSKLELISKMIGRDAAELIGKRKKYGDFSGKEVVCEAIEVSSGPRLFNVSLKVRKGEIVGLAGLLGSGRTEFAKVIFGAEKRDNGEILVKGKAVKFRSPKDAVKSRIAYCSEDRKNEGIMPHMTIKENMSMAILPSVATFGFVNNAKIDSVVKGYINRINIRTPSALQLIRNLSGGNQQKVILARWLCMNPDFIILDEPTRGIDVGAKAEIEAIVQELSEMGVGVLYISSEIEELVRGCDRIVILKEGKNIAEMAGEEISQEALIGKIAKGKAVSNEKEAM